MVGGGDGGGCFLIIVSALWSRVLSTRQVNVLKYIGQKTSPEKLRVDGWWWWWVHLDNSVSSLVQSLEN